MTDSREFRVRPGQIRSQKIQRVRPFFLQAMAAAQKAGAEVRYGRFRSTKSRFGRGRAASLSANRILSNRSRLAVIKTRVVRHRGRSTPLKAHLRYLQREGVTKDSDKARMFGVDTDDADARDFAERTADDRHHFRFIVSPEDAVDMEDLKGFTRDLMKQMEKDLNTGLDWVGVTHSNTEHPHIHIIVRGKTDQGEDLVISRDYIKEGMRARAQHLITLELGERSDQDIQRALHRQVEAERFTQLDRQLMADQRRVGFVDLAPSGDRSADAFQVLKAGRIRKLETLGLAEQIAPGQWTISDTAPTTLRQLGERGDIIKRIHRGLTQAGLDRAMSAFVVNGEGMDAPVVGRLMDRGLDDELRGSAYAVIDAVDGRTHHVKLPDIDAAGDSAIGSIVEYRSKASLEGRDRSSLVIRSDLTLVDQIHAPGATWLDRLAVTVGAASVVDSGFGAEVLDALGRRAERLVAAGLARETEGGYVYSKSTLATLRSRELSAVIANISSSSGAAHQELRSGDYAAGTYVRRLDLSSGRMAMLDTGAGFQLVPWTASLETQLGRHISGVVRENMSVDWKFGRSRGLGL
jgi:type IV secretory pathway VirD2 relaxase